MNPIKTLTRLLGYFRFLKRRDRDGTIISAYGIRYRQIARRRYPYELVELYKYPEPISIRPAAPIDHSHMALTADGWLTIKAEYAWDGASGPARNSLNIMRGSLVHDALYQMMRERRLDRARHRKAADQLLRAICLADGMTPIRAWWIYWGVRLFARYAARPKR